MFSLQQHLFGVCVGDWVFKQDHDWQGKLRAAGGVRLTAPTCCVKRPHACAYFLHGADCGISFVLGMQASSVWRRA